MATDLLTAKAVEAAKPAPKPYKLSDGRGMFLVVHPSGARTWRLKYRLHGAERSYSCGAFPDIGLAQARKNRDKARTLIAQGIDPVQHRRDDREAKALSRRETVEHAAEAYFRKMSGGWSETHARDVRRIFDNEIVRALGAKPMASVKHEHAQALVDSITTRGAHTFARDVRTYGRAVWREWNRGHGVKLPDPWAEVEVAKGPKPVSHPALPRAEVGEFLRRVRNSPATPLVRLALALLLHSAVRSGELRGATWGEFNSSEATWIIPGARMKNGLDHVVPLSPQVLDILAQIRIAGAELRGIHPRELKAGDLLFPHAFDFARPISENTLSHAVWRAGYKGRHSPHGCRAVFSSWANEVGGFNADAVERALAHVTMGAVRAAYLRSEFLPERIAMMRAWSEWLEAQERTAQVIPFPVATAS